MLFYQSDDNRVDELNKRLRTRIHPSSMAPMSFSPRPVSTKYALFPMLDHVPKTDTVILSNPLPSFLPSDSAPFSGFNVQQESRLKIPATLQRDSAAQYFPSTNSDLYQTFVPSTTETQPHPYLFAQVKGYAPKTSPTPLIFNNVQAKKFTPR